jgi:seryl-tRNA synthetase
LAPEARRLLAIDESWRASIQELEAAQARRNAVAKEIGAAKKSNEEDAAQRLLAEVSQLKKEIPKLEEKEREDANKLVNALELIPNLPLPAPDVPDGKEERDNFEHHHFDVKRDFNFVPKQHFELGEALGQMDFETAAKLSGARFVVLRCDLARLERALGQFMLDLHTSEHGYAEVNPPLLVRDQVMFGTAQLWKFRDDQFQTFTDEFRWEQLETFAKSSMREVLKIAETKGIDAAKATLDDPFVRGNAYLPERHWLIPTAEVPLTNLVREKVLAEHQLPMRFTACTPCFRAEAGAAGKDTRGMIRQHQFTKVELVSIATPEQSKDEHERMLACAEEVLRRLGLHYRVVTLCAGEMGFAAQKTYDIEVWLPGQGAYREISSCSVCGEFQARRMNARYRNNSRQVRYLHTLNGSGVAVGRALIAVLENYQQQDGSITVPDVLAPYMGGRKTIERAG